MPCLDESIKTSLSLPRKTSIALRLPKSANFLSAANRVVQNDLSMDFTLDNRSIICSIYCLSAWFPQNFPGVWGSMLAPKSILFCSFYAVSIYIKHAFFPYSLRYSGSNQELYISCQTLMIDKKVWNKSIFKQMSYSFCYRIWSGDRKTGIIHLHCLAKRNLCWIAFFVSPGRPITKRRCTSNPFLASPTTSFTLSDASFF